jgi:hypothetical protein
MAFTESKSLLLEGVSRWRYSGASGPLHKLGNGPSSHLNIPNLSSLDSTPRHSTTMAGTRRSGRTAAAAAPKYAEIGSASEDSDAPKRNAKKTPRKRARKDVEVDDEDEDDDDNGDAYVYTGSLVTLANSNPSNVAPLPQRNQPSLHLAQNLPPNPTTLPQQRPPSHPPSPHRKRTAMQTIIKKSIGF